MRGAMAKLSVSFGAVATSATCGEARKTAASWNFSESRTPSRLAGCEPVWAASIFWASRKAHSDQVLCAAPFRSVGMPVWLSLFFGSSCKFDNSSDLFR
jgi:hypothetical protein